MPAQKRPAPGPDADGATEQRILRAARTVFMRRGTAGARMQEIAEEAGVNQALLHYYFRSKDRLADAVFREAAFRLIPGAAAILGGDDALERKVERFVHFYIDNVRAHPFIPGYILAELHQHPERIAALATELAGAPPAGVSRDFLRRLARQIDERVAAGAMRPVAPEQFLVNLIALCVFPFAARPLLSTALGMDDAAFGRFLDARRAELPRFILDGLRP